MGSHRLATSTKRSAPAPARPRSSAAATPADAPIGRRERSKLEKRARIVEAARDLFNEKGFEATTTLEISERANVGSGTLFLYAKTKEELLVMAFSDELLTRISRADELISAQSPLIERLLTVFMGLIDYHRENTDLSRHLLREVAGRGNPDISTVTTRIIRLLAGQLAIGQADGFVKSEINREEVAFDFFFLYYTHLLWWINGAISYDDFRRRLKNAFDVHTKGLAPPKRRGKPAA